MSDAADELDELLKYFEGETQARIARGAALIRDQQALVTSLETENAALKERNNAWMLASTLGWAWSEVRAQLDSGQDPRKQSMPDMLERCKRDLLPIAQGKDDE